VQVRNQFAEYMVKPIYFRLKILLPFREKSIMFRKSFLINWALLFALSPILIAATWEADPAHSSVAFTVKHMMIVNVHGSFDKFTVSVNYDEKDITKSTVQATIDATSVNTNNAQRDTHLKSADFFEVTKFPTITFVSKQIQKTPTGLLIIGDLTMHGVTKEVTLNVEGPTPPMTDPWGGTRIAASATATVNRTDYGIVWNKTLESGGVLVGNDVNIDISVELVKK
jgi:polyisoprenoid-binding protein YceI